MLDYKMHWKRCCNKISYQPHANAEAKHLCSLHNIEDKDFRTGQKYIWDLLFIITTNEKLSIFYTKT